MLWFYYLCVIGLFKRLSRREIRWYFRIFNYFSFFFIIRYLLIYRFLDLCRFVGTVIVDRLNFCMIYLCSCFRRCGGGSLVFRIWVWRIRRFFFVRLEDSSKVCLDVKVFLYLLRYILKCLYFYLYFIVFNFKVFFESKMYLSEIVYSFSLYMYMYMFYL